MRDLSSLHIPVSGNADQSRSYPVPLSANSEKTKSVSMLRSFQDPWEHQAFYRGADMKVVVTTSGKYCSSLIRIDLPELGMQRNDTSLPQVFYAINTNDRCAISLVTDRPFPSVYHNGYELLPDMVVVSSMNSNHHCRMLGPSQLGTMSLSRTYLAAVSHALIGRELMAPAAVQHARISGHLMVRLQRLHDATCHLAATTPDILAHPQVARAIEEELVRTMVHCLAEADTSEKKSRPHLRVPVMQRFERAVGEAVDEPLYVTEICDRIGVHERTLRNHCLEYLGISPHRYLWLRRMHQVRRALSLADPAEKTVTTIANDYGFWELGRFSVGYRELFGESPSTTLRNSAEHKPVAFHSGSPTSLVPILP
jgi:AraC-like DNA-binding protein